MVRALDEAGIAVESLELVRPTLDDVFVAKTGYHLEEESEENAERGAGRGMSALATNARVVRALGMRSIRQTFRRPQLIAPIIVFPTLLLAIQTGGAGGAIELPGFPPVQSFLQFMLAGAMMQSLMLAGNSGGIALAVDIEMGFTDRLFSAPIPRFAIVLGRLAGTAALGLFGSLWFLAIGLIFGAEIESGVPGALLAIVAGHRGGDGGRRDRRRDRPAHRQRQRRPGPLPAGPRRPLPLLRLLPAGTDDRAGEDDRRVQPAQLHRRRGARADHLRDRRRRHARRGAGDPGIVVLGLVLSARALRHRLRVG